MAVLKFKLEIKSVIFTCLLLCRFHCLSLSKKSNLFLSFNSQFGRWNPAYIVFR